MVTVNIYMDKRLTKADGKHPVRVRITKNRKSAYVTTRLTASPEEWNDGRFVKRATNSVAKNALLNRWQTEIDGVLLTLERTERLECITLSELTERIAYVIKGEDSKRRNKHTLVECFDEYMSNKNLSAGTKGIYMHTRNKIVTYDAEVTVDGIDKKWLERLRDKMAETMNVNAYGIHLRNIRAVMNYAIDEEYTTNYPFRKFQIKKEETEKRCLTVEQVRELRDYPVEGFQRVYRDMWMLMFYLVGINAVDLFGAKKSQLRGGRLEYKRAKTGTLYSIEVRPEAMEIIDRYAGDGDYLLSVMDHYGNYKDFLHRMNLNLQRIGEVERKGRGGKKYIDVAFPGLSSYWSRHTWATIAAELDIPIEVISHALGHKIGSEVTAIYVKFNRKKVDEANRRVIEFVNQS